LGELRAELNTVKSQGRSTCINEKEFGVTALASPIRFVGVGVIYSVGVITFGYGLPNARFRENAEILKAAAVNLATSVGPQRNLRSLSRRAKTLKPSFLDEGIREGDALDTLSDRAPFGFDDFFAGALKGGTKEPRSADPHRRRSLV
jgi:hypothetical protein